MTLHLTKVAFGATSFDAMQSWFRERAEIRLTTRYLPKRHEELIGGSLYWILKHQLVGRSTIIAFEPAEGGRTHIVLRPELIPVRPVPRRAHQGWRYLESKDAPPDLMSGDASGDALPPALAGELSAIGLL